MRPAGQIREGVLRDLWSPGKLFVEGLRVFGGPRPDFLCLRVQYLACAPYQSGATSATASRPLPSHPPSLAGTASELNMVPSGASYETSLSDRSTKNLTARKKYRYAEINVPILWLAGGPPAPESILRVAGHPKHPSWGSGI